MLNSLRYHGTGLVLGVAGLESISPPRIPHQSRPSALQFRHRESEARRAARHLPLPLFHKEDEEDEDTMAKNGLQGNLFRGAQRHANVVATALAYLTSDRNIRIYTGVVRLLSARETQRIAAGTYALPRTLDVVIGVEEFDDRFMRFVTSEMLRNGLPPEQTLALNKIRREVTAGEYTWREAIDPTTPASRRAAGAPEARNRQHLAATMLSEYIGARCSQWISRNDGTENVFSNVRIVEKHPSPNIADRVSSADLVIAASQSELAALLALADAQPDIRVVAKIRTGYRS